MGLRTHSRLVRVRLDMERLEDRTTPAKTLEAAFPALEATGAFAPDRVNVVMVAETNTAADEATLAASPFAAEVNALGFGIYSVSLAPGFEASDAVIYYSSLPGVLSAAPDEIVQVQLTPNDTYYAGYLYGMTKIGAPAAWDTTTGSSSFVVAVIDSGVDYNHPDLAANIWSNTDEIAGNGTDDDGNGYIDDIRGWDFYSNDNNPFDDNGHGTHVAGTIGAVGNNSRGVVGVNWSVKIMPLKFLGANGSGSISGAVGALNYAVTNGAKVSNNSWGGGGFSSAMSTAISRARDAGHIFVAAAGNSGQNNDSIASYPANYNYDNVVSVAATNSSDVLASFSNYGASTVDLAAPGVSIASTTPNNGYAYMSGTSMAAPHVSGAIALYWSANPSLSYSQVIDKLLDSVDTVAGLSGKVATGGRLNVGNMFESTSPPPPPPPPPTVAPGPKVTSATFSGNTGTQLNNLRVTFDRAITASSFTSADIVSFTGPNGGITTSYTITPVSGSSTQFDITFAAQTAGGTYSMIFGPDIRDTSNNQMNQDADATAGENPGDRYTATGSLVLTVNNTYVKSGLPVSLIDVGTRTVTMTIADDVKISDLNVGISLTHTWLSDLVIKLKGPDGTTITLFNRRGGSANNLTGTTFNDEASTAISAGTAPFSGNFRPEQALSAFDGKSTKGTWSLIVQDVARYDTGSLTAWSLVVAGTLGSGSGQAKSMGFMDGPAELFDTPADIVAEESATQPARDSNPWPMLTSETDEAPTSAPNMNWMAPEEEVSEPVRQEESSEPRERDSRPVGSEDTREPATVEFASLYFAPDEGEDSEAGEEADPISAE
ncbi:MAG: S8 family serine peptidase [Planctomycetia bacterium]|nr:S8 family serine peptidase [Planctomycetia bacterium]